MELNIVKKTSVNGFWCFNWREFFSGYFIGLFFHYAAACVSNHQRRCFHFENLCILWLSLHLSLLERKKIGKKKSGNPTLLNYCFLCVPKLAWQQKHKPHMRHELRGLTDAAIDCCKGEKDCRRGIWRWCTKWILRLICLSSLQEGLLRGF